MSLSCTWYTDTFHSAGALERRIPKLRLPEARSYMGSTATPSLVCPNCSSAVPMSAFRIARPFECSRCGEMLSASELYSVLPVLALVIAGGSAYWFEIRGVSLALATVVLALPVNMVLIKAICSLTRPSIRVSSEKPRA